jgi:hypothetical protein
MFGSRFATPSSIVGEFGCAAIGIVESPHLRPAQHEQTSRSSGQSDIGHIDFLSMTRQFDAVQSEECIL